MLLIEFSVFHPVRVLSPPVLNEIQFHCSFKFFKSVPWNVPLFGWERSLMIQLDIEYGGKHTESRPQKNWRRVTPTKNEEVKKAAVIRWRFASAPHLRDRTCHSKNHRLKLKKFIFKGRVSTYVENVKCDQTFIVNQTEKVCWTNRLKLKTPNSWTARKSCSNSDPWPKKCRICDCLEKKKSSTPFLSPKNIIIPFDEIAKWFERKSNWWYDADSIKTSTNLDSLKTYSKTLSRRTRPRGQ